MNAVSIFKELFRHAGWFQYFIYIILGTASMWSLLSSEYMLGFFEFTTLSGSIFTHYYRSELDKYLGRKE